MNVWFGIAAINGALAVVSGAFAAHGLNGRIEEHAHEVFETGARYHMYHALAIGLAALVMRGEAAAPAQYSAALFLGGIVLFSGSLYLLALTGWQPASFVTPVGGLLFLAGWLALAWASTKVKL